MHFKLLIALVEDDKTNEVLRAARNAGATGSTVINHARGEGLVKSKTFFGLNLTTARDVLLFVVEEHLSRKILEEIATVGAFEEKSGTGIAFQLDIEDAVGLSHQIEEIQHEIEDQL